LADADFDLSGSNVTVQSDSLASGTDLEAATREALNFLDQSLNSGFRPGMGHVLPDRLFWAEVDDEEGTDDSDNEGPATAEDFSLPRFETKH
jgi:hydroxymethylpyrimidine/phosphomethylpyrimidine kinase